MARNVTGGIAIAGTGASARCQKRMATDASNPIRSPFPVIEEELVVGRRTVETGRGVRLHKSVTEETLRIAETLQGQELQVEHVPVNVWIEGVPPVQRQEGDTLVIPVLEEVLVVQKRLRLTEEIRITARARSHTVTEQVVLRKEQVTAERFDDSASPRDTQDAPPS